MLQTLVYHRACGIERSSNTPEMLQKHLEYISKNFDVVLPGDPLSFFKTQVCLTFDDATVDFYYIIYPLLKKLNLKAILGVPVGCILDDTLDSKETRLSNLIKMKEVQKSSSLCTFKELKEMLDSGLVQMASHSLNHVRLTKSSDYARELEDSKTLLESKLDTEINSFIYPYGVLNHEIHRFAKQHYKYIFRLGNSLNLNWSNGNQLIYRQSADSLKTFDSLFKYSFKILGLIRCFFNISRFK